MSGTATTLHAYAASRVRVRHISAPPDPLGIEEDRRSTIPPIMSGRRGGWICRILFWRAGDGVELAPHCIRTRTVS